MTHDAFTAGNSTDQESGSVTAEFALTLPIVIAVLALILGALTLATQRVLVTSVAAEIARHEARGDLAAAYEQTRRLPQGANIHRHDTKHLHCVEITTGVNSGPLKALSVEVESCAMRTQENP